MCPVGKRGILLAVARKSKREEFDCYKVSGSVDSSSPSTSWFAPVHWSPAQLVLAPLSRVLVPPTPVEWTMSDKNIPSHPLIITATKMSPICMISNTPRYISLQVLQYAVHRLSRFVSVQGVVSESINHTPVLREACAAPGGGGAVRRGEALGP